MLGVHWAGASWCQFTPVQFAVAPSGVQWLKLPPNWLVVARNGAKIEFGGKKISKFLKFSSRHLHRAISAKCLPSGTKWRKQSAYWNPLECNGARQVAPMRFCATWRHLAPLRAK